MDFGKGHPFDLRVGPNDRVRQDMWDMRVHNAYSLFVAPYAGRFLGWQLDYARTFRANGDAMTCLLPKSGVP